MMTLRLFFKYRVPVWFSFIYTKDMFGTWIVPIIHGHRLVLDQNCFTASTQLTPLWQLTLCRGGEIKDTAIRLVLPFSGNEVVFGIIRDVKSSVFRRRPYSTKSLVWGFTKTTWFSDRNKFPADDDIIAVTTEADVCKFILFWPLSSWQVVLDSKKCDYYLRWG